MAEPIKRGDLVMVVHVCCDRHLQGSPIFVVGGFLAPKRDSVFVCTFCKTRLPDENLAWDGTPSLERPAYPVS